MTLCKPRDVVHSSFKSGQEVDDISLIELDKVVLSDVDGGDKGRQGWKRGDKDVMVDLHCHKVRVA